MPERPDGLHVVMITQALDATDPLLAFTVDWVSALAMRVAHVHVISLTADAPRLPVNVTCTVIGARGSASQLRRLARFEGEFSAATRRADVVLAHMCPRYVCWGWPTATLRRIPVVLWYTHRRVTAELRLATAMSRFVATATDDSFGLDVAKRRVLGHGIAHERLAPGPDTARDQPPMILMVGRLMPIKGQEALLRALAHLGDAAGHPHLMLVGGVPANESPDYLEHLRRLAVELQIVDRVTFCGAVPPDRVREFLARATVAVSLTPPGSFDKAVLEGMMAGTPTVVSNPAFDELLQPEAAGWRPDSTDPVAVAASIARVLALPDAVRSDMATAVRARAIARHGVDGLADRLVDLLASAAAGR